jgi:hypothetical protein
MFWALGSICGNKERFRDFTRANCARWGHVWHKRPGWGLVLPNEKLWDLVLTTDMVGWLPSIELRYWFAYRSRYPATERCPAGEIKSRAQIFRYFHQICSGKTSDQSIHACEKAIQHHLQFLLTFAQLVIRGVGNYIPITRAKFMGTLSLKRHQRKCVLWHKRRHWLELLTGLAPSALREGGQAISE